MPRRSVCIILVLVLLTPTSMALSATAAEDQLTSVSITPLEDADGDGAATSFEITIEAGTSFDDTDTFGNNPGEPYFEIEIDGTDVAQTGLAERSETYAATFTLTEEYLEDVAAGDHDLTVELWDKDGDNFDSTDLGNDDLLDDYTEQITYEPSAKDSSTQATTEPTTTSTPTTTTTTDDSQLRSVTVTPLDDSDNDGAASAFRVSIEADTELEDSDLSGSNPGEPYFEVEIDGTDYVETVIVERSETFAGTLELSRTDLNDLEAGDHDLSIEFWDQDGDRDETDLGNDDLIDTWTTTITYEQPTTLSLEASRTSPPVGSPVSIRVPGGYGGTLDWSVVDSPSGSSAPVRPFGYEQTATIRPDVAGAYTIEARDPASGGTATITISASGASTLGLLRGYAPRLHYDAAESYHPTRYEAFVGNAGFDEFLSSSEETPTMFDLGTPDPEGDLDLNGTSSDFPSYDDDYPVTVHGSVHENVDYRGESYTALTYWLFYIYDPKDPDGISSILAHQSDLETVTILLQDGTPEYVGASQHYGGEVREWEKVSTSDGHVDIYPAVGAHSNYFRNTENYGGDGILPQVQFKDKTSLDTSIYNVAEGFYTDTTGDDRTITNGGENGYQIVPLTGNEYWAAYEGPYGHDGGVAPFHRDRLSSPGQWIESRLAPDEKQVNGTLSLGEVSVDEGTLETTVELLNDGPKPHPIYVVVEAKPATESWDSPLAVPLHTEPVFLGAGETETVDIVTTAQNQTGPLDVRVQLTAYPPTLIGSALDILDQTVLEEHLVVDESTSATATTPSVPPSSSGPATTALTTTAPATVPSATTSSQTPLDDTSTAATVVNGRTASTGQTTIAAPTADGSTSAITESSPSATEAQTSAGPQQQAPSGGGEAPGFGTTVAVVAFLAVLIRTQRR